MKYPTKVSAIGGHFMFDDDQETPNTLTATFEFDDAGVKKMTGLRSPPLDHQSRSGHRRSRSPATRSAPFSTGRKATSRSGTRTTASIRASSARSRRQDRPARGPGNNWANFIDAVRSRKHSDLNAPIEEGAISTTLVHLANISYRLGRSLHFDETDLLLCRR